MLPLPPRLNSQVFVRSWRNLSALAGVVVLLQGGLAQAQFANSSQIATHRDAPVTETAKPDDDVVVETESAEPSTTESSTPEVTPGETATTTAEQPRFACELQEGQYTVVYHPESQPGQAYPWAKPSQLGGGWTPQLRCQEISRRLEFYRPDGLLEMRTAVENNYNTVCVTTQKNADCRIVLTVPPGEDPMLIRDRVFQNLTVADRGDVTQAVNTFVDGGRNASSLDRLINLGVSVLGDRSSSRQAEGSIKLRPFLDPADGGTGAQLQGGTHSRTAPRLNPSNFR